MDLGKHWLHIFPFILREPNAYLDTRHFIQSTFILEQPSKSRHSIQDAERGGYCDNEIKHKRWQAEHIL